MAIDHLTLLHIAISLIGIATGFGALAGLLAGQLFPRWVAWFLTSTLATSLTGFCFPLHGVTPAMVIGAISTVLLVAAMYAIYLRRLAGSWRVVFVVCSVTALYLNVFVLIVQTFLKNPALLATAPTQTEPPFAITQGVAFLAFSILGVLAVRRFHPAPPSE